MLKINMGKNNPAIINQPNQSPQWVWSVSSGAVNVSPTINAHTLTYTGDARRMNSASATPNPLKRVATASSVRFNALPVSDTDFNR